MGVNYHFNLAVGFEMTEDELYKPFEKHFEEESHLEDRYDPKTGKKLTPEKVVTKRAYDEYYVDGERVEFYDLDGIIAEKLECQIWECNDGGEAMYVIGPSGIDLNDDTKAFYGGPIDAEGYVSFQDVAALGPSLEALKVKLNKYLNMPLTSEPVIRIVWRVG